MGTVKFNANGSNLILRVISGPPCLGGFSLWIRNNLIGNVKQIHSDLPNLIHDSLPDNLILPFSLDELQHINLRIVGRYGPLPNHTQISVRYLFYQDDHLLNINPDNNNVIKDNLTPPPPYNKYTHDFIFQPK